MHIPLSIENQVPLVSGIGEETPYDLADRDRRNEVDACRTNNNNVVVMESQGSAFVLVVQL